MKTKYLIAITLLLLTFSCKKETKRPIEKPIQEEEKEMDPEQRRLTEFGNNYTKAWNSQNPQNVASFFADDGTLVVNNGIPFMGKEDIAAFAKGFMTAFPDMELTMDSLVIKTDETHYHWNFVGTNSGEGGTGNKVEFSGFERWTLNDNGLVKVSIGSFDEDDYNRQVTGVSSE